MTFVILTAGIDLSVGSSLGLVGHLVRRGDGERRPVAAGHRSGARRRRRRRRAQRARHHEGRPAAVHHDPGHAGDRPRRDDDDRRRQADPLPATTAPRHRLARQRRRPGRAGPAPALRRYRRARPGSCCATRRSDGRSTPSATTARPRACRASTRTARSSALYVISGLCAAVAALIVVSRLAAAEPTQGTGFELDAIAIVVIGGTSLFGGEGGVGGTVVGAASWRP